VWGVRLDEVAAGDAAQRHASMLRLVGLKGHEPPAAPQGQQQPVLRTDGPKEWVAHYRPDLVLVLLGTNDLRGAEPSEVFARLGRMVNPMLAEAHRESWESDPSHRNTEKACLFKVAVSTLPVHFASSPPPPVPEYNSLLGRFFGSTKEQRAFGCDSSQQHQQRMECSPCLTLIDGAGAAFRGETADSILRVTYDSIHPNAEGESRIAHSMFRELVAQRLV
jgi:hypothetical protein